MSADDDSGRTGLDRVKDAGFVVVIAVIAWVAFNVRLPEIEVIQARVDGYGVWGPVVFVLAYALLGVTPVPISILSVAAGLLFGVVGGSLISVIASTAGALGGWAMARLLGANTVDRLLGSYSGRVQGMLRGNSLLAVLLLRLTPMFPSWVVNYSAGVFGVKSRPYLVGTLVGGTPGQVSLVAIGAFIASPTWPHGVVVAVAWVVVAVLALLTLREARRRRRDTAD